MPENERRGAAGNGDGACGAGRGLVGVKEGRTLNENVKSIVDSFSEISDWLWHVTATTEDRAGYLCNQLMRAIDSVGANICEGFGRQTDGQLRQFYGYARGSALESAYWLDRAIARKLVPVVEGVPMLQRLRDYTTHLEGLIAVLPKGKS